MESQTLFLKIIVIGDSSVGKTCLIHQFCYNYYKPTSATTVGCDFTTKVMSRILNRTIKLQLWDIAGQEKYKAFSKLYLRGATGCIIVSDILRIETLKSALGWKDLVNKCFDEDGKERIPIILFQNKVDLLEADKTDNIDSYKILQEFDKDKNFIGSVQTSAKENQNLKEGISRLIEEIIKIRDKFIYTDEIPIWNKTESHHHLLKNDKKNETSKFQKKSRCCK